LAKDKQQTADWIEEFTVGRDREFDLLLAQHAVSCPMRIYPPFYYLFLISPQHQELQQYERLETYILFVKPAGFLPLLNGYK
jgi:hypothetical protein